MLTNFQGIEVLCGDIRNLNASSIVPFDRRVCSFLNKMSVRLMRLPEARAYPDVVTFAFFCRKGNISKLAAGYRDRIGERLGRGLAFHIAPGNVPINFAYTLVAGLLSGNACVVKASSRDFAQTRIIAGIINQLLSETEFQWLPPYITIVIYPRDRRDVTDYFSSLCSVRVIWGGNQTIAEIKKSAIPPRSLDIAFADRYSLCVMDAAAVAQQEDLSGLAHDFYNDTYLYDQNACSSPRLIYWIGEIECVKKAQDRFWKALYDEIKDRYDMEPVISVDKYLAFCRASIELDGVRTVRMPDRRIDRIMLSKLTKSLPDYRCAGGSYLEYHTNEWDDLWDIVDERYQTLSYFGADPKEVRRMVIEKGLRGIDRIVPVGKAADFELIWDGFDLIMTMSREIAVRR